MSPADPSGSNLTQLFAELERFVNQSEYDKAIKICDKSTFFLLKLVASLFEDFCAYTLSLLRSSLTASSRRSRCPPLQSYHLDSARKVRRRAQVAYIWLWRE